MTGEAMQEDVPSISCAQPSCIVEDVEAGVVDVDVEVDTCKVYERWTTQPPSMIGEK
jgi:hypothetical protein